MVGWTPRLVRWTRPGTTSSPSGPWEAMPMAASRSTRTCARTCTALLLGGILTLLGGVQQVGAAAFASPTPEHPQADPQGNAGVVKIDALPFDDHPDNQPHVGCTFQIDLTGFAAGHAPVGITFAAHHPTLAGGD